MRAAPGSPLKAVDTSTPCPCGNARGYALCCQPLHRGEPAPDAKALMRSRYSAYVLRDEAYLLATWHPDTRPHSLGLGMQQPPPTWLGLQVKDACVQDADHATVEFIARFRIGGGRAQRLHERSRFVRENGRWYYRDGDILSG